MSNNNTKSDNTSTLLIWEEIPEVTYLYVIPNAAIDATLRSCLEGAHGQYVGAVGWDKNQSLVAFNEFLYNDTNTLISDDDAAIANNALAQYKVDSDKPLTDVVITHIYRSGFFL